MPIRFIHTADLHLGIRLTRFDEDAAGKIAEARFQSIERIRNLAVDQQVDFIVIAGDLFDDASVDRHLAGRVFSLFEGLRTNCPVFVIPGNHDPLMPGAVWDRDPWNRVNPPKHLRLLRERRLISLDWLPVDLFPCPLYDRRDLNDPTAWIAEHPRTNHDRFRIGIAHGSLRVLPDLPMDDHLIRKDAAEAYQIDYLALGHWHSPFQHKDRDGTVRTAYCGTHEPMRFPGSAAAESSGWVARTGGVDRAEGDEVGSVSVVSIAAPGAPPQIESVQVSELSWIDRHIEYVEGQTSSHISEIGQITDPGRRLLRLRLTGVVEPELRSRIIADLGEGIFKRFHQGSTFDADSLLIEPTPDQLQSIVGRGILKKVLEGINGDIASADPGVANVGRHARNLLYQIAWEARQ